MPASTAARVLTVEDDPIVRADLRLILEDHGFDVCADARDGAEAVDLAREHRPDLILIDLNLPEVGGVEATRQILNERDVPIVAFTGHSNELLDRAVEAGAVAHVAKPFIEAQLVYTLRDVLEARRSKIDREAEHHHVRVAIERMARDSFPHDEIVAAVHTMTGTRAPNAISSPLRRGAAWLRDQVRR